MDVSSLIYGYSKALYSTWLFYKPDHLLIDCGEGAATAMGNGSYAIERILLTHGHIDHISGLPSLLWARAAGMGDSEKPLEVFYPAGDVFVQDMLTYLERTRARLPFEVRFHELEAGAKIQLSDGKRHIETFATSHIPGKLTLGYKIVETRRRLKPQFAALTQEEIRKLATTQPGGGRAFSEDYQAILAAFGGDGVALDADAVRGAELLWHEATLLDAAERKNQLHATLDEAVRVAVEAKVKNLVLYHVSGRYRTAQIAQAIRQSAERHAVDFPIWCLFRERLWQAFPASERATARTQSASKEPSVKE